MATSWPGACARCRRRRRRCSSRSRATGARKTSRGPSRPASITTPSSRLLPTRWRRSSAGNPARAVDIVTKRIYEPATTTDGHRVLIMRLWPRGIRKERVSVWLKELGPVPELLRAYLDETITWEQYVPRYLAGLERPEAQAAIAEVRRRAAEGRVTLLCGCPDQARCHRTLLRTYLLDSARGATPRPRRSADKPRRRRPRPRHAGRRRA